MNLTDPRHCECFRFIGVDYANGEAHLRYAFDDDPELTETIEFPDAPAVPIERQPAFKAALQLLHLIAGVSYYKAGVQKKIQVEGYQLESDTAGLLHDIYLHGLGEFAYHNKLDLQERVHFPADGKAIPAPAKRLGLPRRTLIPLGGGKDSLVTVEMLKMLHEPATVAWVGDSALIAACAQHTGLPTLNIRRTLSPLLFEYNRIGAWNGHIPVTAINSAILAVAAILYGYDAIAFSNEHSASSATLKHLNNSVNHQWSKSYAFECAFHDYLHAHIAVDLDYFSLLRPWSELAVARQFARLETYHSVFSSCNRNFRILGGEPADRWCGQCPKCHFVFLALAPFMPKLRLLAIFGRNLLDDSSLVPNFDALLEYKKSKPFECVGDASESRAALYSLSERAEWQEDAIVAHFTNEILPHLDRTQLLLAPLLAPSPEHQLPARLRDVLDAFR